MFNVQTINCMQYSERRNEINTQTEHLKNNNLLSLKRGYLFAPERRRKETKKQERKAKRIIKHDGGNDKKVELFNYDFKSLKTLHKQNHCRNHKAALNEEPTGSLQ